MNDSNYYSLPLGRRGTREARHGQEGGLHRTGRGGQKRTVVETVGPERDHEESGNIGERTQTVDPCVGRGETDHSLGDTEMGSVQGSGIQTGGWRAFLDEVSQDLEDLRGVGDHGDDLHGLVASRAAQGVRFVDLLDQAGPGGAALFGGYGQLGLRLLQVWLQKDEQPCAQGWLYNGLPAAEPIALAPKILNHAMDRTSIGQARRKGEA